MLAAITSIRNRNTNPTIRPVLEESRLLIGPIIVTDDSRTPSD